MIYLSIYPRSGSRRARAHLLHYVSRGRVLYFDVGTYVRARGRRAGESKVTACSLPANRDSPCPSSRHCMLRTRAHRATPVFVATGSGATRRRSLGKSSRLPRASRQTSLFRARRRTIARLIGAIRGAIIILTSVDAGSRVH